MRSPVKATEARKSATGVGGSARLMPNTLPVPRAGKRGVIESSPFLLEASLSDAVLQKPMEREEYFRALLRAPMSRTPRSAIDVFAKRNALPSTRKVCARYACLRYRHHRCYRSTDSVPRATRASRWTRPPHALNRELTRVLASEMTIFSGPSLVTNSQAPTAD